jgi:hypothetical protein
MTVHRVLLAVLYTVTCLAVLYVLVTAGEYYGQPLSARPHHYLDSDWRPSGHLGHGLGVAGGGMMLILLIYSVRKRLRFAHGLGSIRVWLDYHIWLGITGPLLIVFHTAFKVGGLVSISFWSMIAVALSGVLGRYIYVQIPHTEGGEEISAHELVARDNELQIQLEETLKSDAKTLAMIQNLPGTRQDGNERRRRTLIIRLRQDFLLPWTMRNVRDTLVSAGTLSAVEIESVVRLAKEQTLLRRRILFLATAKNMLHHWHVIHRPFAIVMILFMVIHVVVAIIFGHVWIFASSASISLF